MNLRVVFHPYAEADLDQIYEFIAEHSPPNAIGFVRRLRAHCSSLATMPRRGRPLPDRERELRTTPFENRANVIYRIDSHTVTILRVGYAGRDTLPIPVSDEA